MLAQKITSQEVQDFNTSMVGMGKALAALESGGMQTKETVMNLPQPNLFSFAFVDPSMLLATMTLKYGKHFADDVAIAAPFFDCQRINLRSPDGVDLPMIEQWPSARQTVDAVMSKLTEYLGGVNLQLGAAYVESLRAGGTFGWYTDDSDYAKAHNHFRLLVSPCSGGTWYSAGEMLAPGVGNLTYLNKCVPHSMINLGPVPQISLVVDIRKPMMQ